MSKFLAATLACLPFIVACGGPTTPDNEGGGGGAGSGTSFLASINATPPVPGVIGSYYLNDNRDPIPGCSYTATCTFTVEAAGHYTLDVWFPDRIAVLPKNVEVANDGQVVNVSWGPNEWGLAPQGEYYDQENGYRTEVRTTTDPIEHTVRLLGLGIPVFVTGNRFYGEHDFDGDLATAEGMISDDLTEINYHIVNANASVDEGTLRFVH